MHPPMGPAHAPAAAAGLAGASARNVGGSASTNGGTSKPPGGKSAAPAGASSSSKSKAKSGGSSKVKASSLAASLIQSFSSSAARTGHGSSTSSAPLPQPARENRSLRSSTDAAGNACNTSSVSAAGQAPAGPSSSLSTVVAPFAAAAATGTTAGDSSAPLLLKETCVAYLDASGQPLLQGQEDSPPTPSTHHRHHRGAAGPDSDVRLAGLLSPAFFPDALLQEEEDACLRLPLRRAHTAGLGELQLFARTDEAGNGSCCSPALLQRPCDPESPPSPSKEEAPASSMDSPTAASIPSSFAAFLRGLLPMQLRSKHSGSTNSTPVASVRSSLDVPRPAAAAAAVVGRPGGAVGRGRLSGGMLRPPPPSVSAAACSPEVAYKQHHGYLPSPASSFAGGLSNKPAHSNGGSAALSLGGSCSRLWLKSGSTCAADNSARSSPATSFEGERVILAALPPGAVPLFGTAAALRSTDALNPQIIAGLSLPAMRGSQAPARAGLDLGSTGQQASDAASVPPPPPASAVSTSAAPAVPATPLPHQPLKVELGPPGLLGPLLLAVSPRLPPSMRRATWALSDFALTQHLYQGFASTVCRARDRVSGRTVAIKVYRMSRLNAISSHQVAREVRLHAALEHKHLIQLIAAWQEAGSVVLVQEYASGGDLWSFVEGQGGRLTERVAVSLVLQPFLTALLHIHSAGIAHRDIKPENILFGDNMALKISDLGLAVNLREERAVTRVGTLDYMPPEVLRCPLKRQPGDNKERADLHYAAAVDAWAVGVLAYELLTGRAPFSAAGASDAAIEATICGSSPPLFPSRLSNAAKSFISAALNRSPAARPSIRQMLQHPWVRSFQRSASRSSLALPASSGVEKP